MPAKKHNNAFTSETSRIGNLTKKVNKQEIEFIVTKYFKKINELKDVSFTESQMKTYCFNKYKDDPNFLSSIDEFLSRRFS